MNHWCTRTEGRMNLQFAVRMFLWPHTEAQRDSRSVHVCFRVTRCVSVSVCVCLIDFRPSLHVCLIALLLLSLRRISTFLVFLQLSNVSMHIFLSVRPHTHTHKCTSSHTGVAECKKKKKKKTQSQYVYLWMYVQYLSNRAILRLVYTGIIFIRAFHWCACAEVMCQIVVCYLNSNSVCFIQAEQHK